MMMADKQNVSIYKTAVKMWKDGGYFGLFRGNLATMLKIVPQTATQFAVRKFVPNTRTSPILAHPPSSPR